MLYQVTMKDVGRRNECPEAVFNHQPTYVDLYGMVRPCLYSSNISFEIARASNPGESTGKVYAGFQNVGTFIIREMVE